MAIVIQNVWHENSDNPHLKHVKTQTTLNKEKKNAKFDKIQFKDFVTEASRKAFGHKCNKCKNKNYCDKWQGKIIIICDEIAEK